VPNCKKKNLGDFWAVNNSYDGVGVNFDFGAKLCMMRYVKHIIIFNTAQNKSSCVLAQIRLSSSTVI
jgi:hypothetical protein